MSRVRCGVRIICIAVAIIALPSCGDLPLKQGEPGPVLAVAGPYEVYRIAEIGTLGGGVWRGATVFDINEHGHVIGSSNYSAESAGNHAFLWRDGVMTDLGTLGGSESAAWGINNRGDVVGWAWNANVNLQRAVLWSDEILDIGTFGGTYSIAHDINDSRQVIGTYTTPGMFDRAFLWKDGGRVDIGPPAGGAYAIPRRISNDGFIVGDLGNAAGQSVAFSWYRGALTEIPFPVGGVACTVVDLSEDGRFLVRCRNGSWVHKTGSYARLPDFGDLIFRASALNRFGDVVGVVTEDGGTFPILFKDGQYGHLPFPLNHRTPKYCEPQAINDAGVIAGICQVETSSEPSSPAILWRGLTALEQLEQLVDAIDNLKSSGVLSNGDANVLNRQVRVIASLLTGGRTTPCLALLRALTQEIRSLERAQALPTDVAASLVTAINRILASIRLED